MSLCFLLFPQANQVLQSFLQSQAGEEAAILQADQALTDADKAMAGTGEDWTLRGEGGSCAAIWKVWEQTLREPELPLLLWNLSATCGNNQGSLGFMYIQSGLLHHMLKQVVWCGSRNSQTPSHQFNVILIFELRTVQLSITAISLKLLWNRGTYQETSSRDETGSANTETEW